MENISAEYLFRAEAWLLVTTLIYFIMNGAGIFETATLIPKWSKNAPDSLQLFNGEYGVELKVFWTAMHSIHEINFIVAIIFCWNIPGVREMMLLLFGIHLGARVLRNLNYIRTAAFIAVSVGVLTVFTHLVIASNT